MSGNTFQTPVKLRGTPVISPSHTLVSLGSCFSDNMGQRLKEAGFAISVNPFGTLFHPYSLFGVLDPQMNLDDEDFLEVDGSTHHYRLPKTFYERSVHAFKDEWRRRHESLHQVLSKDCILLLTLGTSHLYVKQGKWVANCHQQPSSLFEKTLTSLGDMECAWKRAVAKLPPKLKVIVTVSPVRHLKDGLAENNLSKSLLRVLAHSMVTFEPDRIHYFPAYEILLDELRDYRYYAKDMLHPSEAALDHIWELFRKNFLDETANAQVERWAALKARIGHRPLHPDSANARRFQEQLEVDLKTFYESLVRRS
jgi:hypothetical protein